MGAGGVRQGARARPADLSVDRLFDVPLVPRDGARVVREPGDRRHPESRFHLDQSRSRRAARRRSRLHDVRAGDDRIGRLADERVADARSEAVLRRHLFPARRAVGQAGISGDPSRDRPRVAAGAREGAAVGREPHRADQRAAVGVARRRRARRRCAEGRGRAVRADVRPGARRVRRRAEVSAAERAAVPAARDRAHRRLHAGVHGGEDAAADGARRHARPRRRRLSPLFGRRQLARAALREDAVRPGADHACVPRNVSAGRRSVLCRSRGRHARVRDARDDQSRGRLFFGRGRRQRAARRRVEPARAQDGRRVLSVDAGASWKRC